MAGQLGGDVVMQVCSEGVHGPHARDRWLRDRDRATTARGDGGEWILVVLWGTAEAADAAAAQAEGDPSNAELMALVDRSTLVRKRYSTFD